MSLQTEPIASVRAILWLRHIPRFGHTTSIAKLASDDASQRQDYVNGLVAFCIFIIAFSCVWAVTILALKLIYGPERVGCAAGGQRVDVSLMRKHKLSRSKRRAIIVRNWRTQVVFLLCSINLVVLSFLCVNHGLDPFLGSLESVYKVARDVDNKAARGLKIATNAQQLGERLTSLDASVNVTEMCPNYESTPFIQEVGMQMFNQSVSQGVSEVNMFVDQYAQEFINGIRRMSRATEFVEEKIDTVQENDWLVEGFLIAFNVANVLLFFGALLTRNGIQSPLYQWLCSYVFVPTFCIFLTGAVALTCIGTYIGLVNADFCSGGVGSGSPKGTFMDIMTERGLNSTDVSFKAVEYYSTGCPGVNPLSSLVQDFGQQLLVRRIDVQMLQATVNSYNLNEVSAQCGGDMLPFNDTITAVRNALDVLSLSVEEAKNLTSCGSIAPIFQRIMTGAPCTESIKGLSGILGTTCGMLVLGLIMMSTRAALYNPIIKPRRKKRREREFKEYAEFMGTFYDTSDWKLDPPAIKKEGEIPTVATFETDEDSAAMSPASSQPSSQESAPDLNESTESSESVYVEGPEIKGSEAKIPTPASEVTVEKRLRRAPLALAAAAANMSVFTYTEDPEVEYYSTDSEDDASVGPKVNMSALVSRFFVVDRADKSCSESHFSADGDLSTSRMSFKSLLAGNILTPIKKAAAKLGIINYDIPFDESVNESLDGLSLEVDPLTPSPKKAREKRAKAPHKHRRSILRTHGASQLPPSRSDNV